MAKRLLLIGEAPVLFKAMMKAGPLTSELAGGRAGRTAGDTREWLRGSQAAGGYLEYDPGTDRYTLPDERTCAGR